MTTQSMTLVVIRLEKVKTSVEVLKSQAAYNLLLSGIVDSIGSNYSKITMGSWKHFLDYKGNDTTKLLDV